MIRKVCPCPSNVRIAPHRNPIFSKKIIIEENSAHKDQYKERKDMCPVFSYFTYQIESPQLFLTDRPFLTRKAPKNPLDFLSHSDASLARPKEGGFAPHNLPRFAWFVLDNLYFFHLNNRINMPIVYHFLYFE